MKIDPYNNEAKFLKWKESVKEGIPDLTPQNSRILLDYLSDMEIGQDFPIVLLGLEPILKILEQLLILKEVFWH